ncbi:hypothetical protein CJF32_00010430 [Rutstroemia sp. NJR-2017a WRK4]|nr:hypothetical protein CJF32_00010430 [Rutstroemia sp. NJR-2017a WRK4]
MHLFHIFTLASTASALVTGRSTPVSDDLTLARRQASNFCTTIGFTSPYCCIPQADAINLVFAATSCMAVPGGATITSIKQYEQACLTIDKVPLCCAVIALDGTGLCSGAAER